MPPRVAGNCQGCSRRTVLRGAAAAAAAVLAGCGEAAGPGPDRGPTGVAEVCGANLCIDLDDPANAALVEVDGSALVAGPHEQILVIRVSATAFEAVSNTCTHAGCAVGYAPNRKRIRCPCHGSEYQVTGEVLVGPALRPLTRYATVHDASSNVLTIML